MSVSDIIREQWDSLSDYTQAWARRTGRCGNKSRVRYWDSVASAVVTFPDGDDDGACDVEILIGDDAGWWFLRTRDDAGGGDDADDTAYPSRQAAVEAAEILGGEIDEAGPGEDAEAYLDRRREEEIERGRDPAGQYALVGSKTGVRWDDHRYASADAARKAAAAWQRAMVWRHGGNLIWHLMDCPDVAAADEGGDWKILEDEDGC